MKRSGWCSGGHAGDHEGFELPTLTLDESAWTEGVTLAATERDELYGLREDYKLALVRIEELEAELRGER